MDGPVNVDLPFSKSSYPFGTNILILSSEAWTILIEVVRRKRKPETVPPFSRASPAILISIPTKLCMVLGNVFAM